MTLSKDDYLKQVESLEKQIKVRVDKLRKLQTDFRAACTHGDWQIGTPFRINGEWDAYAYYARYVVCGHCGLEFRQSRGENQTKWETEK